MLATFSDYGISADAGVQHRWGKRLLRWYASLGHEPRVTDDLDITKYGGFCEIVAELAVLASPLGPFETRHLVNVGFAFLAFLAVYRMGRRLAGPAGALASLLFLALTPRFYGHAFANAKDIPLAGMFALATWAILACDAWPSPRVGRVLLAGVAIGLAAAVRVGAIVLFGFALVLWLAVLLARSRANAGRWPSWRELVRLGASWVASVAAGWAAMIAFWPWAMLDPLRNPFRAADRFSSFWAEMLIYYDGRLLPASQVSRFYLPSWFALTLPETYLVAVLLGLVALFLLGPRRWSSGLEPRLRLLQTAWAALIPASLITLVVVRRMPLYDGLRHFLFLMPLVALVAGVSVAAFFRAPVPRPARWAAAVALGATGLLTLVDMVRLHPYQAIYFNRLVAGGMKGGVSRYEGDYWCLTYKEGCEWLLRRYAGTRCREPIRVAGHSVLQQIDLYLDKTEEGRRLFRPVLADQSPNFILTTTRFLDHLHTPGRAVYTVEREGATLFYLFEVRAPSCEPAPPGESP